MSYNVLSYKNYTKANFWFVQTEKYFLIPSAQVCTSMEESKSLASRKASRYSVRELITFHEKRQTRPQGRYQL